MRNDFSAYWYPRNNVESWNGKGFKMGKTDGFKVRVGVIVLHPQAEALQQKLLLVRQNNRPFWVFPGGTLEPGEGLMTCGVREMAEELNMTVCLSPWSYLADFFHPKRQVVDVFFQGFWQGGDLRMTLDENLNEVGWYTRAELEALDVRPALAKEAVLADWQGLAMASIEAPATVGRYLGTYALETE